MKRRFLLSVTALLGLWSSVVFGIGDTFTLSVDPADPCAYPTIQAAVDAVPDDSLDGYIIEIAPSNYNELVDINDTKQFITLRGMGAEPYDTYLYWATSVNRRGVLRIYGYNIRCENLTVENTTTHGGGQAEALETFGDKATFENCRFISYQDTIRHQGSGTKRSYTHNCHIEGRTDFIWHKGVALFEDCNILSTYSSTGGYITAAGTPWEQRWGFIFKNCNLFNDSGGLSVYLGRPWRGGAMTSYLNCWMDGHISLGGWREWNNRIRQGLTRYSEYNTTGPGAASDYRIHWAAKLTDEQVAEFTNENILAGWDPNITTMPTIWKGARGYWHQRCKWEDGLPTSNSNAYIPTDSNVIVLLKAEASTVTLDGTAKLYIDGGRCYCKRLRPIMHKRFCNRWRYGKCSHRGYPQAQMEQANCNQFYQGYWPGCGRPWPGADYRHLNRWRHGKCHHFGQGNLTVDELACRSTTAEVHIINYGQFSPFAMTGFKDPAGILYVEQGSFESPNIRGIRLILAPAEGDDALVTVNEGDDWYVEQIQTGSGCSMIEITGGLFYTGPGFEFGGAGPAILKVTGGGATINMADSYLQEPNGVLAAENVDGAISTIVVRDYDPDDGIDSGNVVFADGAKLLLETAWGVPAGEYVLMKWNGTRTGTLTLDPSVDPNEWSFFFDDVKKQLKVNYTPQEYVNLSDFTSMAGNWAQQNYDNADAWDLDNSGSVDLGDIEILSERWMLGK